MSYVYPRVDAPVACSAVSGASASQVYAAITASRTSTVSVPYAGTHSLHVGGNVRPHRGVVSSASSWGSTPGTVSGIRAVQATPLLCTSGAVPTTRVHFHGASIRAWAPQIAPISESSNQLLPPMPYVPVGYCEVVKEDLSGSVGSMDTTLLGGASLTSDSSVNGDEVDLLSHTSISVNSAHPSVTMAPSCTDSDLQDVGVCLAMIELLHRSDEHPESPRFFTEDYLGSASSSTVLPPMPQTPNVPFPIS